MHSDACNTFKSSLNCVTVSQQTLRGAQAFFIKHSHLSSSSKGVLFSALKTFIINFFIV